MTQFSHDLKDTFHKTVAQYARRPGAMGRARRMAAPAMRFASRNPVLMIGAGVLALAGVVAYANRRRIAASAGPLVEEAKVRGRALMDTAGARGQALLEAARTKGGELAEKVKMRRGAAAGIPPADVH